MVNEKEWDYQGLNDKCWCTNTLQEYIWLRKSGKVITDMIDAECVHFLGAPEGHEQDL